MNISDGFLLMTGNPQNTCGDNAASEQYAGLLN